MKASLLLAEAATTHPDGTISMLRSGITHIWGEKPPFVLQGMLVIRIETELGDDGNHNFDLRCLDMDGKEVIQPLAGGFVAPQGTGVTGVVLGLAATYPKAGQYLFVFRVDNTQLATLTITTAQRSKEKKQ